MTTPMRNRLPFRFADGGATPIEPPLADPQQQNPGILVGPDDPSLGEYGRGWQLKQAEIDLSDERRAGWPNRAGLRQTVANSWREEGDRIPPAAPHLAMALSNLVSMEGEAYYPVQDWLADLKERHKAEQDRHYQMAARNEAQGRRREAAYHPQAAEDWQQASGVEEEIYGSALQREGWQVITPKSAKGGDFHFSGGRFRELAGSENDLGEKIGGRFTPFLGLDTHELPELDRLMREKYGSRAYLVEYKDMRGGIDTSHPFAVVGGQIYGAYDPQELDTPKPLTTVYIPPENWSPPNYEVNHDLIRERREREQRIAAAGRPATPAEVTTEVADLYQQIDTGTDYTETQAQEIQEALQEARSAAAEAHAAAERATTLASLARRLASGAATDVRSSRLAAEKVLPNAEEDLPAPDSGDLETLERDAEALGDVSEAIPGDYDPESYPTSGESVYDDAEGPIYGPESPFTAADDPDGSVGPMEHGTAEYAEMEDQALHPIAGPDPESDYTNEATSEPLAKQGEELLIGRHVASLNPADKNRHPALIIRKAIIKAEKAEVIADEAVEASQEAAAASGRMTAAFARLRRLARAANVKADSLPDHADDAAQRYADMSDAEIAEAMPIVQRTNQRVLMARDMALYAAAQSDLAVKVASSNESWLHGRFEKLGIEHRLEDTAFAHAELAELTWVDVPEEHREMFEDHLERRVEQRREDKKPPDYLAEGAPGETLTPHFAPTTVVVPENQPLEKEKIGGRSVEGYRLDGVFYPLDDLNPVMDPNTGRQEVKAPPDWVEPDSPDDVQRLVFEQKLENVPQVDPNAVIPPPQEDNPGDGPAGPREMRDYQEDILTEIDEELEDVDSLLVAAPTGAGKCHPAGTLIMLYSGALKAVEDIEPGDLLMGPDSRPRTVESTSTGYGELVEIRPVKGDPWYCNREHVLSLVRTNDGSTKKGEVFDVSVTDWLEWTPNAKHIHKLFRVGVEFPNTGTVLPAHPYILGLFLGDGSMPKGTSPSITTEDQEIVDALVEYGQGLGLSLSKLESFNRTPTYRLTGRLGKPNPLTKQFKAAGIYGHRAGDKFIPQPYLVADREDRLQLLAGLLDTDGSCSGNNYFDYVSKSKALSEGVTFLARSLGLAAYLSPKHIFYKGDLREYWRVSISGDVDMVPTRIPRKQARPRLQKKDPLRTGFSVHDAGEGYYYGFTLDGDGRYLLGDFTVTHNTVVFSEYIRRAREEDKTVAVVTHREELLKQATGAIEAQTGETPGIVWREQQEWNQPITVISHGSLVQDNRKPPADFKADIVIFDEAHHAAAEGWQSIREKLNPDILLGFTATPFRDDEKPLTPEPFARVIRPVTPADLIKRGALVPAKVERVTLTNDKGEVVPIGKANNLPTLYAEGVAYALGQGRRKVIVYVSQSRGASPTKIVRDTKAELDRLGINAGMVISTGTTREEREQALEEFSKAPRAVLVNYQTLVEGYNEPATDAVIIGRNSSSEGDLVQMVGRGLRTSPGKTNCLVLDYSGRDDLNDIINYWRVDKEREEPTKRTKHPGNPWGEAAAPRVARKAAPDRQELAVSEKRPGKLAAEVEIIPKPTYGKSNQKLKVAEKAPLSLAPADPDDLDRETVVVQGRRRGRRRRDEEVDNRPPVLNVTFG